MWSFPQKLYLQNITVTTDVECFDAATIVGVSGKNGVGKSRFFSVWAEQECNAYYLGPQFAGAPFLTVKNYLELLNVGCKSPFDLQLRLDQLSSGQLAWLRLIVSISLKPKVLILDEVTSFLDIDMKNELSLKLKKLKESNSLVIIISHDPFLLNLCADYQYEVIQRDKKLIIQRLVLEK